MIRGPLLLAACAGLALVGGCNRSEQPAQQPAVNRPNETQTRLQALPEPARNAVFIRAIRDAGFDCQHVTHSAPVAGAEGAWTAQCDDGTPYVVAIGANGQAQVTKGAPAGQVPPNAA